MKRILFLLMLLGAFCVQTFAQTRALPIIDRTCHDCDRRYLDSLNVFNRRPIRINQAGFRPQDYKYAYVADIPAGTKFSVIDANSGAEAYSGTTTLIKANAVKPGIWVRGAYNSLVNSYTFQYLYSNDSSSSATESLTRAEFSSLNKQGEYFVVIGSDTSATFHIHPGIYNALLEYSLNFFGIQRCGNTKSHFHAACHLKDGSAVGHDLTGGWHDCGDHFKVSETVGYATYVLSLVYLTYQDKAEDNYGNSYADSVFTDGIPDILYEAKIGTDYILKLYNASKADGLLEKGDMYHTVGMSDYDHRYWDLPERQDKQIQTKGGPDRLVLSGIGTNVAGIFAASLANVGFSYQVYDPEYADSLMNAAKDIYAKIVKPTMEAPVGSFGENNRCARKGRATTYRTSTPYSFEGKGYYSGMGLCEDDAAAAATALWFATGDTMYKYDLFYNVKLNDIGMEVPHASNDLAFFKAGYLGTSPGFNNSWATDYQNLFAYVLFSLQKLILNDNYEFYGIGVTERDELSKRIMAAFRKQIQTNTIGDSVAITYPGSDGEPNEPRESETQVHVETPYNLVWTSFDWGVIRYNLGSAVAVFLLYEIMKDERYLKVALDNMYYALGANPWDISFLVGAGDKNPQHPHNRAANPDGYNAGGMPYEYRCPIGALMGGRMPTRPLIEDWQQYTSTETCIDFSAQFLFPAQSLAETLPLDLEGPLYSNIAGTPITDTSAIISWDANEIAITTVFYSTTPNDPNAKSIQQTKATKGGSITINGLTPGATYYFYLSGMDTKRNISTDDNHGLWYSFTMTLEPITISGVTICQVDHRSAKIYWWSSSRANGVVNYGSKSKSPTESKVAEGGAVMFHEAELTGLQSGTTYYFTVSSGTATSEEYSFTTEEHSVYADIDIHIKPSSYQDDARCSKWEDCKEFFMIISNNDTVSFKDFEIRFYLNSPNLSPVVSNIKHCIGGNGEPDTQCDRDVTFGTAQSDGAGAYYLPITVNGELAVSGQLSFQILFHTYYDPEGKTPATFKDLVGSWSLRPHTEETDPVKFKGIDLENGPYFNRTESDYIEKTASGDSVIAYVKDPYIGVFYHGKHIYGYTPEDGENGGPVMNRTISLNFDSPFKSPQFSIEKEEPATTYSAVAKVSPTGLLDDVEKNAESVSIVPIVPGRTDAVSFNIDTTLAYGNNYIEWVAWHNHFANMNSDNKYDCACTVIRTNVEIDTITVPPEQRYFEFTVDTINVYTGRFAEVHVILKDSLKQQMFNTDMKVTLGSDNNLLKFYTSPTATLPTEIIDIVKGEAVFYIKADSTLQAEIYTLSNSTKEVVYTPAKATVIVEDLPPWPIITMAKMTDQDCDNVPDAMYIRLSNAYSETSSFSSIKFSYGKDTLTADKVLSMDGTDLFVTIDVKDTSKNTNPSGSITLISKVENESKESVDFYGDAMAPTVLSISVLERLDTATVDRVYIQFSEPISIPGNEWPLQLYNRNTQITTPVNVKSVRVYNDSLNVWEFTIDFDSDGSSIVKEGMGGQLMLSSKITDKSGNGVGKCSQPIHNIGLKILPIPMTYAYIADKDEDGLAEYVEVTFTQKIDDRHKPDSISIVFGSAAPETLWTSSYTFSAERTTAVLNLKAPFKLGNTSGNYTGSYQGRELIGAGLVMQHMGAGAAYETNSTEAEDKAGPVFVTAAIKSSDLDILTINASEPLVIVDSMQTIYLRERNREAIKSVDLNHWALLGDNTNINAFFESASEKAVIEGDRIRLAPNIGSMFTDKNSNQPAANNPWVTVGGEGTPKIKYNVNLASNVIRVDPKKISPAVPGDDDFRIYVVNPITHKLDLIQNGQVVASIDTNATPLQGGIWTIDLTVPRGSSIGEAPAWSSLDTKYRLLVYTNLGSFVNHIEGKFQITPDVYYSSDSKVTFIIEWATLDGKGIRSENGRIVGTGAYIGKIEVENKFTPNSTLDEETQKRYSSKNSYDKTKKFGILRIK